MLLSLKGGVTFVWGVAWDRAGHSRASHAIAGLGAVVIGCDWGG